MESIKNWLISEGLLLILGRSPARKVGVAYALAKRAIRSAHGLPIIARGQTADLPANR